MDPSEATPTQNWLIRAWLYLPIIGGLAILTVLMARKNIGFAWFLAVLTYAAFEGIRYLDRRYSIGIPTRIRVLQGLGAFAFCIANTIWSDLTDGERHLWGIAFATIGSFTFAALPFVLFLAPKHNFLPTKTREGGQ